MTNPDPPAGEPPAVEGGRRLRVAIVHYTVPPVVGGVERVIADQATLLADDGHRVTVIAGRGETPDPRVAFHAVSLVDSAEPRVLRLRERLDAGVVPEAFATVRDELATILRSLFRGHDLILAHNVCSLHFNLALTAALHDLARDPHLPRLVAWHHDLAWTQERHRGSLHEGYPWSLLRTAWPGVVQVAVSETRRLELAGLLGLAGDAIRVVRNGIDIDRELDLAPLTRSMLARTGMLGADPLLLTPARITPRKNIELGLELVARMRGAGRPAGLAVTGPVDPHDPTQQEHLDRLRARRTALDLEEAAWFLGADAGEPLPGRVVSDLYRVADALFLPSREEGFGLPILEAALHRLPIICTDLPVLREIAGDAATYLDPDGDPGSLAALVLARLDADTEDALWRRIRRRYAWPEVYRRELEPLLRDAVAGRGGAAHASRP